MDPIRSVYTGYGKVKYIFLFRVRSASIEEVASIQEVGRKEHATPRASKSVKDRLGEGWRTLTVGFLMVEPQWFIEKCRSCPFNDGDLKILGGKNAGRAQA